MESDEKQNQSAGTSRDPQDRRLNGCQLSQEQLLASKKKLDVLDFCPICKTVAVGAHPPSQPAGGGSGGGAVALSVYHSRGFHGDAFVPSRSVRIYVRTAVICRGWNAVCAAVASHGITICDQGLYLPWFEPMRDTALLLSKFPPSLFADLESIPPYVCPGCGQTFSSRPSLFIHARNASHDSFVGDLEWALSTVTPYPSLGPLQSYPLVWLELIDRRLFSGVSADRLNAVKRELRWRVQLGDHPPDGFMRNAHAFLEQVQVGPWQHHAFSPRCISAAGLGTALSHLRDFKSSTREEKATVGSKCVSSDRPVKKRKKGVLKELNQ